MKVTAKITGANSQSYKMKASDIILQLIDRPINGREELTYNQIMEEIAPLATKQIVYF
jgi:hypothetical protein